MPHRVYTLAFWLIVLPALGYAQTAPTQVPADQKAPTTSPAAKLDVKADRKPREIDPLVAQRRMTAVSLLTSLADDARSFRDEALRARVQARAADALWDTDKERARQLFRRAWEAAETADAETQRRIDEERRAAETNGKSFARSIARICAVKFCVSPHAMIANSAKNFSRASTQIKNATPPRRKPQKQTINCPVPL